jgi:hypothetical protein
MRRPNRRLSSPPRPSAGQKAALGGAALAARAPRRAGRATAARRAAPSAAASRTISVPFAEELVTTARYISRPGRGILASDESNMTTGKRLASVGVDNTEENRRDWRQLLYTAPGLGAYISGAIMFEETLYQKAHDGTQFVDILKSEGILPGIKVRVCVGLGRWTSAVAALIFNKFTLDNFGPSLY